MMDLPWSTTRGSSRRPGVCAVPRSRARPPGGYGRAVSEPTAALRATARQFLDALDAAGRGGGSRAVRRRPTGRCGRTCPGRVRASPWATSDDAARGGLDELLGLTLSAMGADRTREVMNLDDVLRDVERSAGRSGWERRSSERYWVRVLGDPEDEVWAWHLGGHHVAVHATVVGDTVADDALLPRRQPGRRAGGPMPGCRCCARRSQLARELLAELSRDQRAVAVVSATAPEDIATRHDPVADPDVVPVGGAVRRAGPVAGRSGSRRWCGGTSGARRSEVAEQAWRRGRRRGARVR